MAAIFMGESEPMHSIDWPEGTEDLVNQSDRKHCAEGPPIGGGDYSFFYRSADTSSINKALEVFAKIRAPRLELILTDPPGPDPYGVWAREEDSNQTGIRWMFHIWGIERWHAFENNPLPGLPRRRGHSFGEPPPPPSVTIPVGEGGFVLEDVRFPKNLVVIDDRASSQTKSGYDAFSIHGTVNNMATGRAIVGATVTAISPYWGKDLQPPCITDADGSFIIRNLTVPAQILRAEAKDFALREWRVSGDTGSATQEVHIELCRKVNQKGIVTDSTGRPVEHAHVGVNNALGINGVEYTYRADLWTDASGEFVLEGMPTGFAVIRCSAKGYQKSPAILVEIPPNRLIRLPREGDDVQSNPLIIRLIALPAGEPERNTSRP
jgi:hypothetical protein